MHAQGPSAPEAPGTSTDGSSIDDSDPSADTPSPPRPELAATNLCPVARACYYLILWGHESDAWAVYQGIEAGGPDHLSFGPATLLNQGNPPRFVGNQHPPD